MMDFFEEIKMLENYDPKTNTFNLPAEAPKVEKSKTRGFIVTVADSQEEAEAIQKGEIVKFNISPILASSEQVALEHIEKMGKIALSIVPLELLEMQVTLLYQLADSQKVELLREQLFNIQKN
jgi:hypothetical protein